MLGFKKLRKAFLFKKGTQVPLPNILRNMIPIKEENYK